MPGYRWNPEKDKFLREARGIGFADVLRAIRDGKILDDAPHPHREKYPLQRLVVVEINRYAYLVPYVEAAGDVFLKTIIPSRKATRRFLQGGSHG